MPIQGEIIMPRAKKYKLIKKDKDGKTHARPRCGKCNTSTFKAVIDRGAQANIVQVPRYVEIGRYCITDRIFYPRVELAIMGYE